ncbi:hypothetical protein GCM10023189_35710 [Nibrella saemangeumensis]|uniref:Uncharacterized protein n=1 Tax=Nibrella saemangeumensis TaxID=1084526 RepID=A0ABP8N6V6_9BACT
MRYRELFTVEVLHDYFADHKARSILFTPTPDCEKVMTGAGLRIKSFGNKLYVIVRTEDDLEPFQPLPQPGLLSFYMQSGDGDFFQYSNLPLNGASGSRFYFQNTEAAVVDGIKYLHGLHPVFDNSKAYTVGQFVMSPAGECHECLVNLAPGTSSLGNAAHWHQVGKVAYVDQAHSQTFTGTVTNVPVSPAAAQVTVEVFGRNDTDLQLNQLRHSQTWVYEAPVSTQAVSFAGLPEGLYKLRINGVDHLRYYTADRLSADNIGLIQIFTNDTVPADYRLLDATGQFRSPVFTIRMAPVSPLWQYVARTGAVKKVYDEAAGGIEFEPAGRFAFRSKLPVRLQEKPYDKIALEFNSSDPLDPAQKIDIKKLSVPGYRNKRTVRKDDTDYPISEIYLNY